MKAHEDYKDDKSDAVACGRPVNEILTALERITKHGEFSDSAGNDVRHIFLGGTPEEQARQRASFEQCRKRWETWWSEHWREFATEEELRSVELPKRDQDLVELAGAARYGVLFPTGPQVRLGPVRMLRLTTSEYANGISHLDLDTGRVFRRYEVIKPADPGEPRSWDCVSPPGTGTTGSTYVNKARSGASTCNSGWSTTVDGIPSRRRS